MKGVILAGGSGTRLLPFTKLVNKHLIPVYDKPMIYYPLETLKSSNITDILIISGREHIPDFKKILGEGENLGLNISYAVQEKSSGIADAINCSKNFIGGDDFVVLLGDNIVEEPLDFTNFTKGVRIYLKKVGDNHHHFAIAELMEDKIVGIEEKPDDPKSSYVVTGIYIYDNSVFDIIKKLNPSDRGEYEVTDVNREFLKKGLLEYVVLDGFWSDVGTFEALFKTARHIREKQVDVGNL